MRMIDIHLNQNLKDSSLVGTLVETRMNKFFFEYNQVFLDSGLNLSPFKIKFSKGIQENTDNYPRQSFGLFDDSLPDGWGLFLMDKFFNQKNIPLQNITILDRLAYIGSNGMGALSYSPSIDTESTRINLIDLKKIAENSTEVLQGKTEEILPIMKKAGGSPGGARPKILVGYNGLKLISGESNLQDGYEHWIIKFNILNDFKDAGKIEYIYSQMAKKAGLDMPETKLFEDNQGGVYYGIKRFDRTMNNGKIHTQTLGNMIHANFRFPSLDYNVLMKATMSLTNNQNDVVKAFRMMVFNIYAHNRDDHSKNFAFQMNNKGVWKIAPSYDLTFSNGPGGEHTTSVAGNGLNPAKADILRIANNAGISEKVALEIIAQVTDSIADFKSLSLKHKVIASEINTINSILIKNLPKKKPSISISQNHVNNVSSKIKI